MPPSYLGSLREGLALLKRHPVLVLGLSLLAMLLAQLGPALEIAAHAGRNPMLQPLFGAVGLLPMEMYLLPRLQAQLDAERLDPPQNRRNDWTRTFDQRWLPTFGARMLLSLAVGVGLVMLFLPGLLILTLYGWVPLRILLRGDRLAEAIRWSQAAMVKHWLRVVHVVLGVLLILVIYQAIMAVALARILPGLDPNLGPDAWFRLRHPLFWIIGWSGGLLNVWVSATLLALYHRLEAAVQASSSSESR